MRVRLQQQCKAYSLACYSFRCMFPVFVAVGKRFMLDEPCLVLNMSIKSSLAIAYRSVSFLCQIYLDEWW